MKSSRRNSAWVVFWALALFGLISCILDERETKRGSEVENEVYGVLVALNGKPVPGAKVKAVPSGARMPKMSSARAAADSDSVVTDSNGRYAFKGLGSGRYDLFGDYESGTLVVLIPDVERSDTSKGLDVGTDTLRAPGRIRGRLLLGDRGKEGVLAYVPGTSYLAVSDDSGRFVIGGVPQGVHAVKYSAAGFIIEPDTGVQVLSGKTTDLPTRHLAHDPSLPPPTPTGLKAVYDTLNERVLLSWDPVPVSDLDGFIIYRDKPSFLDPQVVADGFTTDTSFSDLPPGVPSGMESNKVVYRIKSRDKEVNLSLSYSAPVEVDAVSKAWVTSSLQMEVQGALGDEASPGDTLAWIVRYTNPTRRSVKIEWRMEGSPNPLATRSIYSMSGADTLTWVAVRPGEVRISATLTDEGGVPWQSVGRVLVVGDSPLALAGRDTAVSLGDSVLLAGKGLDRIGRIVKTEWDVGGIGTFMEAVDGRIAFQAPRSPGLVSCIFRVTDDDGQAALDTVQVTVLRDAPEAQAGGDFSVSIHDTISLRGSGRDGFGKVVNWAWRCSGDADFKPAPGGVAERIAPSTPGTLACILKATDDDSVASEDTVSVTVFLGAPTAIAGPRISLTMNDEVTLIGGGTDNGRIVSYEWDLGGTGIYVEAPMGRIPARMPSTLQSSFLCVLRVTDDDGLTGLDTLAIPVLSQPPRIDLEDTLRVDGPSIVRLSPVATDPDGIASMEWDIGATGHFISVAGGDTSIQLDVPFGKSFPCIIRATDRDGEKSLDTTIVKGWLEVADKGTIPVSYHWLNYPPVVFNDAIWRIQADNSTGLVQPYRSTDGLNWTPVPQNTSIIGAGGRLRRYYSFKGYLWINSMEPLETIWRSSDGSTWEKVGTAAHPSVPSRTCEHEGNLWLFSGQGYGEPESSPDGLTWSTHPFVGNVTNRQYTSPASFKGALWLGGTNDGTERSRGTWRTVNGDDWEMAIANSPGIADRGPLLFSFRDHLWTINEKSGEELWFTGGEAQWTSFGKVPGAGMAEVVQVHDLVFRNKLYLFYYQDTGSSQYIATLYRSK